MRVGLVMSKFTKDSELLEALKKPFAEKDIEWRISFADANGSGKEFASVVCYIDSRAVQNRLDDVCGIGGWWNEQPQYNGDKAVNQGITIRLPESGQVTKWDGADQTDIESTKGGLSNALKRAGVLFGIGRYLYKLTAVYVNLQEDKPQDMDGWERSKVKIGGKYVIRYWKRPTLPSEFLPEKE